MKQKVNIIGCGRAASSLARLWMQSGTVAIGCILNRGETSTQSAVDKLGVGTPVRSLSEMEPADFWLIGANDDQVAAVARSMSALTPKLNGSVVFHLAGRFGLEVLEPLNNGTVSLAALHPVRSLTDAALSLEDFAETACVVEGSGAALKALKPLVTSIGGAWLPVDSIDRGLYHASVSIISNITKAVAWKAQKWQQNAGLPEETARVVTHQLLHSTMNDLFRSSARQSITGPIVRGDTSTIAAHLDAIGRTHPDDVEVYRVLARTVLELAQERGDLDEQTLARFAALLGN
jgi:predicted short-subunit dehydrogenase-like oxidoreductase (DUF2520 family)